MDIERAQNMLNDYLETCLMEYTDAKIAKKDLTEKELKKWGSLVDGFARLIVGATETRRK